MAKRFRLDDLYKMVAYIYREQNAQRSPSSTFAHFVEVCGMLTIHDRRKKREGLSVIDALCKALGWYFPLLAKLGVRSVEDLIFRKYPYACPYCRLEIHRDEQCKVVRGTNRTVDHKALRETIQRNKNRRPATLNGWQEMFGVIYPRSADDRGRSTLGLFEEIGELAEAIRVFERHPEYFVGEAADVFSYLMGIANEISIRLRQEEDKLFSLEDEFLKRYPGLCPQCGSKICICPSVPDATVGRLAKELEIDVSEGLFTLPPKEFAADGQAIAAQALEAAGGYRGLAESFPFDRGDANRALVMLCLRFGDVLRPSDPDLAERFHSSALRIGSVVSEPGARAKPLEVAELLKSIKMVWRDLEPNVKRKLEKNATDLAMEVGASFGKVRVLFVACSPRGEERVRGDRELRAIRQSIKAMRREEDIEIRDLTAATADDLRRALLQETFDIVHFSGHSNARVLCFEDEAGEAQEISLDSLATYVGSNPSVKCVVLNSCESLSALTVAMADYTVGMDETIDDEAAIKFATGFYDAVGAGRDIPAAVEEGRNAAALVNLSAPVRVLSRNP